MPSCVFHDVSQHTRDVIMRAKSSGSSRRRSRPGGHRRMTLSRRTAFNRSVDDKSTRQPPRERHAGFGRSVSAKPRRRSIASRRRSDRSPAPVAFPIGKHRCKLSGADRFQTARRWREKSKSPPHCVIADSMKPSVLRAANGTTCYSPIRTIRALVLSDVSNAQGILPATSARGQLK